MEKEEKKAYQQAKADTMLTWIAIDIVEYYNQGREADAKASWNELVGAARMFAVAFEDGEANPIHRHAFPTLRGVCESYAVDYDNVVNCLRK